MNYLNQGGLRFVRLTVVGNKFDDLSRTKYYDKQQCSKRRPPASYA